MRKTALIAFPVALVGALAFTFDPVVRTALHQLGRIHTFLLTGRTADGSRSLSLHARLFGFGAPVRVQPPKPGAFMDPDLAKFLQSVARPRATAL